jgi:serine phosphatase RsbU (regulator of sigma subunit)
LLALGFAVLGPAIVTPFRERLMLPAVLYVVAIVPAAYLGRLWPGLVAAGLSWAAMIYFPFGPGDLATLEASDWIVLLLFLGIAVLVAVEEAARARSAAIQDRLAFLAEANRTLMTSLDYERNLARLTRLAVPRLGDWCAIHLRAEGKAGFSRYVSHQDSEKVRLVEELQERYPPDTVDPSSPLAQVLATGRSFVFPRVTDDLLRQNARHEDQYQALRQLGLRSAIVVPLVGGQRVLGALTLATAESRRRYREADLAFVEELARTATMAIENSRLHQSQSRMAETLQNSLLTTDIPQIPGVEVAVRYRPAGEGALVGGDFYDLFELGENSWAVALGDVSGKGPEAAALTGLVRHTIRAAMARDPNPSAVLTAVNRQILRQDAARFCTAAVARVERTNTGLGVLVSCAGHPPPLVYRPGQAVETPESLGALLGVFPDPSLVDVSVGLGSGDAIVFYTDGVIQRFERAGRGGDAQLVALLWESEGADANRIADRIYEEAAMSEQELYRDDMAIVILQVRPESELHVPADVKHQAPYDRQGTPHAP